MMMMVMILLPLLLLQGVNSQGHGDGQGQGGGHAKYFDVPMQELIGNDLYIAVSDHDEVVVKYGGIVTLEY